jgi:DNA-binding MarR family transcriptional regulator
MSSQVLSGQKNSIVVFARLLRVHSALTRALSAQLEQEHGLTISDYEVLLRLSQAPERRLKRVELAESVVLTPSGITRLLDGLETAGLVDRAPCAADRRVTYAVLTDEGERRLRAAAADHLAAVEATLSSCLDEAETARLAELLGKLPGVGEPDFCRPPPA